MPPNRPQPISSSYAGQGAARRAVPLVYRLYSFTGTPLKCKAQRRYIVFEQIWKKHIPSHHIIVKNLSEQVSNYIHTLLHK